MFVDLLLSGWLRENNHEIVPVDIWNVIKLCYFEPISPFSSYSIRCHKAMYQKTQYLSYVTSTGRCRQSYKLTQESQFRFIPMDSTQTTFKIQNVYPDQRFSKYLRVEKQAHDKNTLGLYANSILDATLFQLEMMHNKCDHIQYCIKYIDENKNEYYLGTEDENYEYNQLYNIQKDAVQRQIYLDLNPANQRISYQYISIFSYSSRHYVSFHDYTKFVREIYSNRCDSQFELIPVDETNANQLYYIRNIFIGDSCEDRYNFWVGFEEDDDAENTRKMRIYKSESRRAIFKFVEIDNDDVDPKKYHIYVYYEGEYATGGWLGRTHNEWNILYNDKSNANIYGISIYNERDYLFSYSLINIDALHKDKNYVYSIYSHRVKRFFSYRTASAECRTIYTQSRESQFGFIPVNDRDTDIYFIRNQFPDKRLNYWLGFEKDENDKLSVRMYENEQKRAIWRLVAAKVDSTENVDIVDEVFKIFGYYEDNKEECGWLHSIANGNWNYLSPNETDAFIYSKRLFSVHRI